MENKAQGYANNGKKLLPPRGLRLEVCPVAWVVASQAGPWDNQNALRSMRRAEAVTEDPQTDPGLEDEVLLVEQLRIKWGLVYSVACLGV